MTSDTDDFFEGKRPWSVIKDEVLASYLPAYLAKIKLLNKPILIVDGFAGPGVFEDGSIGSPVIICSTAEKHASGNYSVFFINKRRDHHDRLTTVLTKKNWFGAATPIMGNTVEILPLLPGAIRDHSIFLYLDPFGPTGSPFKLLEPFLSRNARYSTEIVLMMHMPVVHRLAARKAVKAGREDDPKIKQFHSIMSDVFGGDYWKPIMFKENHSSEEREIHLINAYKDRLANFLPFVGSCPVRESARKRIKYFIVFASRHADAMLLMNDAMTKAYSKQMHRSAVAGTLFANTNWEGDRYPVGLREKVIYQLSNNPGLSRKELWVKVVQSNFMNYLEKEYKLTVQQLVDEGVIECPTPRKTKRLNDSCKLFSSTK